MAELSFGASANVFIDAGQVVRVSTSGVASVVMQYGGPSGTDTITANTRDYGPYGVPAKIRITATSGTVTYREMDETPGFTAGQVVGLQSLVSDDGIAAPATNLAAAVGSAGALTGAYYYSLTFVTALGETAPWAGTATVVNPSAQRVNLTSIPTGPAGVIARRIYRTPATPADPKDYRFVAEISDNTTTTYTDNLADGSLGAPVNWNATNRGRFRDAVGAQFAEFSDQSTGLGQGVFATNAGYASTGIGFEALKANTTGRRNTAIGVYALTSLTTGFQNTAVGVHAGQNVTTQRSNVFMGMSAGFYAGVGSGTAQFNVALGDGAMYGTLGIGIGNNNIALGYQALAWTSAAAALSDCIGIGAFAGQFANNNRQVFIDTNASSRASITAAQDSGLIYAQGNATASSQILHLNAATRVGWAGATVSQLPAASTALRGFRAFVIDASVAYTSANVGSTVAGGGANVVPVFCNGTNWVIG